MTNLQSKLLTRQPKRKRKKQKMRRNMRLRSQKKPCSRSVTCLPWALERPDLRLSAQILLQMVISTLFWRDRRCKLYLGSAISEISLTRLRYFKRKLCCLSTKLLKLLTQLSISMGAQPTRTSVTLSCSSGSLKIKINFSMKREAMWATTTLTSSSLSRTNRWQIQRSSAS